MRATFRTDMRTQLLPIAIGRTYPVLAIDIRLIIGQKQERIVVQQVVYQRPEEFPYLPARNALTDLIDRLPEVRV